MKDYERLTDEDLALTLNHNENGDITPFYKYAMRLWELENGIKRGEIIFIERDQKATIKPYTDYPNLPSWATESKGEKR